MKLRKSTTLGAVVFRCDASLQIGTGHVMRCLTLANKLVGHGAEVLFICRSNHGNLNNFIKKNGFEVAILPRIQSFEIEEEPDALAHSEWLECSWKHDAKQSLEVISGYVDWLIVDHYALDQRWETQMRAKCARIMCIDDLADRAHDCDLLLDQSLGRCSRDYETLLPENAKLLLGPKYALLRPEFAQWRDTSLARRETPQLRHILVTMGGVDVDNVTGRVLTALQESDIATLDKITVVLGPHAPWREQVTKQAADMPILTQVLTGVDNMAELMTSCDLAIGAGGSTTWERCALGVPTIQIELALNQKFISSSIQAAGVALVTNIDEFKHKISALLSGASASNILKNLSARSAGVTNGSGVEATIDVLKRS